MAINLLLGCHLFFVIYEGDALGDVLKINGNEELAKKQQEELNIHELLHCVF
jgi:hypothetical protein